MRLTLPFRSRGLDGVVRVAIRANTDPTSTGHDEIAPNFDQEAFKGFPIATAEVDYPGEGPRGWFAWIQWVKHVRSGRVIDCEVDTPPWLHGPMYVVGYRPTFADAPSNPDHLDLDWVATTYLTVTAPPHDSDSSGRNVLVPLAGFVWGYRRGTADDPTQLLAPQAADSDSWAELAPLLAQVPDWNLVSQ